MMSLGGPEDDDVDESSASSMKLMKIVIVGDTCVGKTSLARRYCTNEFTKQYVPTSGVDFLLKYEMGITGVPCINVNVWDVSGSSSNNSSLNVGMLDKYVFNANIVVVVFDLTNEATFANVPVWVDAVHKATSNTASAPLINVIGNKCDMEHERMIRTEKQAKMAADLNIAASQSFVVSARTGENVTVTFQKIIAGYLGVRINRTQLDHQPHNVVRAEISTYTSSQQQQTRRRQPQQNSQSVYPTLPSSSSSICCLQ